MQTSAGTWPRPIWVAGWTSESRELNFHAKAYSHLMASRNLMARDEFKNLGFRDPAEEKKNEPEKGVKGELLW